MILKVDQINKSFGDKKILRDISFTINDVKREGFTQGQVISLIGRSGSGKSTLFNIMAGLLKPDSGTVSTPSFHTKEGDMGVVFQNSYIFGWRKVKKLLTDAAKRGFKDRWADALTNVGVHFELEPHWEKYPCQLSGGQRQRVAIAEQLLGGSNFILLDEPFSGLDTLTIDRVTKMLTDVSLTDELKTLVIISHDLSNSLAISDTALILAKEDGKEGATITKTLSLVEMGLAWQPDIKDKPEFRELLNQVKGMI